MLTGPLSAREVSAVVCTKNSMPGIRLCLESLRDSHVGPIVVVDASSSDGTRDVARHFADLVLTDAGVGLGSARNAGIAKSTGALILNMGSDNVALPGQIEVMVQAMVEGGHAGVSARTRVMGNDYISRGLNAWRSGRFRPGSVSVIGTPTLFHGDLLRGNPFDPKRSFSDDSELCERWTREFGATFAISEAKFLEVGKANWREVVTRCRMYGESDNEVYVQGRNSGWSRRRRVSSLAHPLKADFLTPVTHLPVRESVEVAPFLAAFTALRYGGWFEAYRKHRQQDVTRQVT